MPLRMPKEVADAIINHARHTAPIEACGYLAGNENGVVDAIQLTNADASCDHFTFVPAEQFTAVRTMRTHGLIPVAVYHSHPVSPARPSPEDLRLLIDPQLSYVIVSLATEAPVVRSFRIINGEAVEEAIDYPD